MGTKYFENVTDFLGKEEERYFSFGYKYIDMNYEKLFCQNRLLTGEVVVDYNRNNKTNKCFHLGTVEYIAIASTICERILLSEFHLSPVEIASSWIAGFKIKIQSCIELVEDTRIQISGKLISTQKNEDSINEYKSCIEIKINETSIKMEINHPILLWFNVSLGTSVYIDKSGLYQTGYKMRKHCINKISLDEESMSCTALVSIDDDYRNKSGLGSSYKTTLLTDIILISGQLVQTLFYTIEKTNRKESNNIWLKEFGVEIKRPTSETAYNAKISFEDVKTLKKGNETWKSIRLRSELGRIGANIKMVSLINNK